MSRLYLTLALGVVALSTAVVFVKLSALPAGVIATVRLLLGALMLVPLMRMERRRRADARPLGRDLRLAIPAGLLLAAHFITWFIGVRMTTAANATLIVNLSPVAMPFVLLLFVGERVNRSEIFGSLLSVAGVVLLSLGSARVDAENLHGDLICIISMVLCVSYMVLARRNAAGRGIFGYLVPLYLTAGLITAAYVPLNELVMSMVSSEPNQGEWSRLVHADLNWPREIALMVALALIPTAIGHGILNYSMVHLRGQVVAVASLGQVFFATLLAAPVLHEVPGLSFYPAAGLVGLGALIVIFHAPRAVVSDSNRVQMESS